MFIAMLLIFVTSSKTERGHYSVLAFSFTINYKKTVSITDTELN